MSLYNMLFGVHGEAPIVLHMLGITEHHVPRFRSAYIENGRLVLYTRTGGGNRDFYESEECCRGNYPEYFDGEDEPSGPWNCDLRNIQGFLYDQDDDFDSTYAYFYYSPPDEYKADIEGIGEESRSPSAQWDKLLSSLGSQNDN